MNVKQFWKAVLAQDEKEIRKYFHKDAYVNWHCTNEHFTIDEYIIANCEYPGEWDGIVERVEMINDLIITVTQIYPKDKSISFICCAFIDFLLQIYFCNRTIPFKKIDNISGHISCHLMSNINSLCSCMRIHYYIIHF